MAHSRALLSIIDEAARHRGTGAAHWLSLPDSVLAPEETVLAAVVGSTSRDGEPVLLATDRRVLVARERLLRGWEVVVEIPGPEVVDAEVVSALLAQKVRVRGRSGQLAELRTAEKDHAARLTGLVNDMVARGGRIR